MAATAMERLATTVPLRKPRAPDDVHDVWNVEVGKPYRGQYVEKIDIETFQLENDRVKVRRLIHLDNEIIIIEDTWHDHDEVFVDGELLPYDQINFPSMDPADFVTPDRKKKDKDDEEKKKKRELLRQRAKDMLKNKKEPSPPPLAPPPSPPPKFDKLELTIKTPDGRRLPVVIEPTGTVEDLKDTIEDDHGIPSEAQNLSRGGEPLDDPGSTMEDIGIRDGDVLDLTDGRLTAAPPPPPPPPPQISSPSPSKPKKPTTPTTTTKKNKKKDKPQHRVRRLNPDSAWVFPTKESAPSEGEEGNLQGIWSIPPTTTKATKEPVEVNIHPMHKEPTNGGDTVHGAYGYIDGAEPDPKTGVVDPPKVVFYPPGDKNFRPDFVQTGWWSSPESYSETKVKWWFEGDDMVHHRVHTVRVCGHEMVFESRYTK